MPGGTQQLKSPALTLSFIPSLPELGAEHPEGVSGPCMEAETGPKQRLY